MKPFPLVYHSVLYCTKTKSIAVLFDTGFECVTVVALARPDAAEEISQKVRNAYKDRFALDCDIYLARLWQGTEIIELKDES